MGNLDDERGHAAARAGHEQAPLGAGAGACHRRPPRRQTAQVQPGRLHPVQPPGLGGDIGRRHHDPLGERPVHRGAEDVEVLRRMLLVLAPAQGGIEHDLVTHRPLGHVAADRADHTRAIGAEGDRQLGGAGRTPYPPVAAVQGGGPKVNHDLPRLGDRVGNILKLKRRRIAEADQPHRSHELTAAVMGSGPPPATAEASWRRPARAIRAATTWARQPSAKARAMPPPCTRAPAAALPAASPETSAVLVQAKASVTVRRSARAPTSVYWHAISGAKPTPASRLSGYAAA